MAAMIREKREKRAGGKRLDEQQATARD